MAGALPNERPITNKPTFETAGAEEGDKPLKEWSGIPDHRAAARAAVAGPVSAIISHEQVYSVLLV